MKKALALILVFLTLVLAGCGGRLRSVNSTATAQSMTATAMAGAIGEILFQDDFQDGQPDNWTISSGWTVQQSGDVYTFASSVAGAAWVTRGADWRDYQFQTSTRITSGGVALSYRVTRDGRYLVHVRSDGLYLSKEYPRGTYIPLTQTAAPGFNAWHIVALSGYGGHLQVYVDGALRLDYTDPSPLLQGTIAVSSLDGYQVEVDDVLVTRLVAPLPVAAPAALPATLPAPAAQPMPDVGPVIEEAPPAQPPPPAPPAQPPPPAPPAGDLPVIDYFTSEPSERQGCYYLHWDLHGATAAYLNDQGVVAPGSEEVCPQDNGVTVYTLRVENQAGQVEQTITFDQSPPDNAQPDLVFGTVSVYAPMPTEPRIVRVQMDVRNDGTAPAGAFTVRWYPDERSDEVGYSHDMSLSANMGVSLDFSYTYSGFGDMNWRAVVDADNDITNEADEGNNEARGTVHINVEH
jgi:hypothetical protein